MGWYVAFSGEITITPTFNPEEIPTPARLTLRADEPPAPSSLDTLFISADAINPVMWAEGRADADRLAADLRRFVTGLRAPREFAGCIRAHDANGRELWRLAVEDGQAAKVFPCPQAATVERQA